MTSPMGKNGSATNLRGHEYEEADFRAAMPAPKEGIFLPGTMIEVIRVPTSPGTYRHVLFDFDGTLSLIREGWPDEAGESITDSTELLNALSMIPTDQRDCIVLKYYYGFNSREIAEMLKVKRAYS